MNSFWYFPRLLTDGSEIRYGNLCKESHEIIPHLLHYLSICKQFGAADVHCNLLKLFYFRVNRCQ